MPHRALFRAIEREFQNEPDTALFGGHRYKAPLCTIANLSGAPLGSITDWERTGVRYFLSILVKR